MKKYKGVVMGFVAGAMCMVTVSAMAATYAKVQATLLHDVIFEFNGEKVASPSDQPVLNYNGYTYLPVRFVGESLDAEVNWDPAKRLVSLNIEPEVIEKVVEVEVPYYVTDPDAVSSSYTDLPASKEYNEFEVEIRAIHADKGLNRTKISLACYNENTKDKRFTLSNRSAKLTVDGEEIALYPIPSKWDQQWGASYINRIDDDDERTEGFLLFEGIASDWEKLDLSFDVLCNDETSKTYTYHIYDENPVADDEEEE